MRDYTKIIAWQKADLSRRSHAKPDDLTVAVYEATRGFPKDEVYALTSQLRRAAYSVPANIVVRVLAGLIGAVEHETGKIGRTMARIASLRERVVKMEEDEDFQMDDDLVDWEYAETALTWWNTRVEGLRDAG